MLHAKSGIRINSVNPGYVLTDVYGNALGQLQQVGSPRC